MPFDPDRINLRCGRVPQRLSNGASRWIPGFHANASEAMIRDVDYVEDEGQIMISEQAIKIKQQSASVKRADQLSAHDRLTSVAAGAIPLTRHRRNTLTISIPGRLSPPTLLVDTSQSELPAQGSRVRFDLNLTVYYDHPGLSPMPSPELKDDPFFAELGADWWAESEDLCEMSEDDELEWSFSPPIESLHTVTETSSHLTHIASTIHCPVSLYTPAPAHTDMYTTDSMHPTPVMTSRFDSSHGIESVEIIATPPVYTQPTSGPSQSSDTSHENIFWATPAKDDEQVNDTHFGSLRINNLPIPLSDIPLASFPSTRHVRPSLTSLGRPFSAPVPTRGSIHVNSHSGFIASLRPSTAPTIPLPNLVLPCKANTPVPKSPTPPPLSIRRETRAKSTSPTVQKRRSMKSLSSSTDGAMGYVSDDASKRCGYGVARWRRQISEGGESSRIGGETLSEEGKKIGEGKGKAKEMGCDVVRDDPLARNIQQRRSGF